jgi:hypothetical protein
MLAKKLKQPNVTTTLGSGLNGTSVDDIITIDTSSFNGIGIGSVTVPSTSYSWNSQSVGNYTVSNISGASYSGTVNIDTDGMTLKENCDIKIGERSLKNFIDRVEEQLAILRPAPELEDRWEKLKDLRQQYEALKADIVEKEKIMKILKEK